MDADYSIACHEAGHAVAIARRGGMVRSIVIRLPGLMPGHVAARWRDVQHKRQNFEFVTFAGPWAEAWATWPADSLDATVGDGCTFEEAVGGAFLENLGNLQNYEGVDVALARVLMGSSDPLPTARDPMWHSELEADWRVMQKLADMVLRGIDSTTDLTAVIHALLK
jgi:hypothetical protein